MVLVRKGLRWGKNMSSINLHTKEINIKVVYYGPGLGGKTTSLQYIHRALRPDLRGQLVSLATGVDRTLYFDFLPVKLPKVKDFTIRMSLYTVPGQVHYNATRKLVLQGCDGVVFVADSQPVRHEANIVSMQNLEDNLRGHGLNPETVPLVLQYNKRDLNNLLPINRMEADLNKRKLPAFESIALTGQGIFGAMKTITKLVLSDLKRKGIYQDDSTRVSKLKRAPVVSSKVEEGLVSQLDTQLDTQAPPQGSAEKAPPISGIRFSELWPPGQSRDPILSIESAVERGEHKEAVRRSDGWLRENVGKTEGQEATMAEALLMLGVHGAHYSRFRDIVPKEAPTREDSLFCLFFVTDIELRMRSVGLRIEE